MVVGHAGADPSPARLVWLCCQHGHLGTLADHAVAADGTVQCFEDGCAFHEMVRLLDWPP